MLLLKVFLHDGLELELDLDTNQTYTFGRHEDCDIVLPKSQSVSRQHFKLSYDGKWELEKISKYGNILVNGEDQSVLHLEEGSSFSIGPYSFKIYENTSDESLSNEALPNKTEEDSFDSESEQITFSEDESGDLNNNDFDSEETPPLNNLPVSVNSFDGDNEKTAIVSKKLEPHLRFVNSKHITKSVMHLKGNKWVGGRDEDCAIHINDKRVSRKQFEIFLSGGSYFIKDLGSLNGTLINNSHIPKDRPTPLKSGFCISILDHYMYFEIKDESFSTRVEKIQPHLMVPQFRPPEKETPPEENNHLEVVTNPPAIQQALNSQEEEEEERNLAPVPVSQNFVSSFLGNNTDEDPTSSQSSSLSKKQKMRIVLIGAIALIVVFLIIDPQSKKEKPTAVVVQTPFMKLPEEKQILVKHSYQLAKNLYMQAKYELAAAEIKKIHTILPQYEDSKEIEQYCLQAFELKKQQDLIERQKQQEAELRQKVLAIVDECQPLRENLKESSKMISCLAPAMELDPENSAIKNLIAEAEQKEEDHKRRLAEKALYRDRIRKGKKIFNKAEKFQSNGRYLTAKKTYKHLLRSGLPDPNGLKIKARRKIASIEKTISEKIRSIIKDSSEAQKKGQLKQALHILTRFNEVDPKNKSAMEKEKQIKKELESKMQVLFQESILEEALGKVDLAIDGWKKIISQDHDEGKYYKKAKIKLEKYGHTL